MADEVPFFCPPSTLPPLPRLFADNGDFNDIADAETRSLLSRASGMISRPPLVPQLASLAHSAIASASSDVARCYARMIDMETVMTTRRVEVMSMQARIGGLSAEMEDAKFLLEQRLLELEERESHLEKRVKSLTKQAEAAEQKMSLGELEEELRDTRARFGAVAAAVEKREWALDKTPIEAPAILSTSITSMSDEIRDPGAKMTMELWRADSDLRHLAANPLLNEDLATEAESILQMLPRLAGLLNSSFENAETDRTQAAVTTSGSVSRTSLSDISPSEESVMIES